MKECKQNQWSKMGIHDRRGYSVDSNLHNSLICSRITKLQRKITKDQATHKGI